MESEMNTGATGTTADAGTQSDAALIAELNDLLKLDHDAVHAYNLAIRALENAEYQRQLTEYRADHERHIEELSQLIRSRGGTPMQMPHGSSSVFKLLVQAVGAAGNDRSVLLAFKSNERGSRDKYREAARRVHPADVTSVLARGADDEARHYAWSLATLEELGVDFSSGTGRAQEAFEVGHAKFADVAERAEGAAMEMGERVKRSWKDNPVGRAAVAAGIVAVAAALFGGARRR